MANLRTHYTMIILVFGLLPLGTGAPGDQSTAKSASLLPEIFVAHNLTESKEANSEERFVGTWEGKCQDERPFVIVALKQDGKQLAGTVSIGNMHGDDAGACMMVLAPPVPEHAQNISNAVATENTLSFNGSKRPDGNFARFELTLTGKEQAQLKLLGSPVENHPWQLVRVSGSK
jgi:hypothetical protein